MDSTLVAIKRYEKQFNAMILLRIEQREAAKQQQELIREKEIRRQAQLWLLAISVGFILIAGLLGIVLLLYRRKRAAYRELVRKSQQWAQIATPVEHTEADEIQKQEKTSPDETDILIMKEIERLMLEEKIYRDNLLSVDTLAQMLSVKRHHVSEAINHCRKKNFNAFVNEYRIKEAIRLLTEKTLSIDSIAFDTGFNDRRNFYRVFKKMTGLSPTQFVENLDKKLKSTKCN